ncbi:MAG: hypothetical protein P0S95_07050 [Rhabdochlamydiaceae bacterium]|nr:hypothetical protein [Candidatus Amphrikana amoebophyrae]
MLSINPLSLKHAAIFHIPDNHIEFTIACRTCHYKMKKASMAAHGIHPETFLELLNKNDLHQALAQVWSEPSTNVRLQYLEQAVNKGHILMMFEYGIALFEHSPTKETLITEVLPLFEEAATRLTIDAACYTESDVLIHFVLPKLNKAYSSAIDSLCVQHLKAHLDSIVESNSSAVSEHRFDSRVFTLFNLMNELTPFAKANWLNGVLPQCNFIADNGTRLAIALVEFDKYTPPAISPAISTPISPPLSTPAAPRIDPMPAPLGIQIPHLKI